MRVEKLIYGPVLGWLKSESGKIMENNMSSYTPVFDSIVLQNFKTKIIKEKPLSLFKTGKYIWLEKQEEKKEDIYENIDEMLSSTLNSNEDK